MKKKNDLNRLQSKPHLTLQEQRVLAAYLSRIDPRKISTREVKFPVQEFLMLAGISELNESDLEETTRSLLQRVVTVPEANTGGYRQFQLFMRCRLSRDDNEEWAIFLNAHDDALPVLFNYKERYFTYEPRFAFRLRETTHFRLYELLKQYQTMGYMIVSLEDLKRDLYIPGAYPRYSDFRLCVLEKARISLETSTDIRFTYEPYGTKGRGGKIKFLRFTITRNNDYVDQLTLEQATMEVSQSIGAMTIKKDENDIVVIRTEALGTEHIESISTKDEKLRLLMNACEHEFTVQQMDIVWDRMIEMLPSEIIQNDDEAYRYLVELYDYIRDKDTIAHRFGYFLSLIGKVTLQSSRRTRRYKSPKFVVGSINSRETPAQRKMRFDKLVE